MGQDITATALLDKAIAYHDPDGAWGDLQARMYISLTYPDGSERLSEIEVDLPGQFFSLTSRKEEHKLEYILSKAECLVKLDGNTTFSEEDKKNYGLSCERARNMRDYYLYLYGLPMKLRDTGTRLHPVVKTKRFKGKEYLVLKVSYEESVGKDSWYFYFDPATYAMEVYQFFHDESKNDGEYILLSEIEAVSGIKMPKVRAWYYNKDDKYLGTDTLVKSVNLR